jgi:DASS family divalent anion:Na+ symporter
MSLRWHHMARCCLSLPAGTSQQRISTSLCCCPLGAAPNPLALSLAKQQGVVLPGGDWTTWVKGSCIPALVIMSITPVVVLLLYPPRIRQTPEGPQEARGALKEMGSLSYRETVTMVALLFSVTFWISGQVRIFTKGCARAQAGSKAGGVGSGLRGADGCLCWLAC